MMTISALFILVSRVQEPVLFLLPFPVLCILKFLVMGDKVKSPLEVADSTCRARE